jgi:hypothetical protein
VDSAAGPSSSKTRAAASISRRRTAGSFAIRRLHPGHFSWIHLLSIFTFCTLTLGLWFAIKGDIARHRGYMRGSYFGLLGAFVGAVAVPVRAIPQLAVNHPLVLLAAAASCALAATGVIGLAARQPKSGDRPASLRDVSERI